MYEIRANVQQNLLSTVTLNQRVKQVTHFLEANNGIIINQTKFKMKIKLAREIKREKEGIPKDQVRETFATCDDIRLETCVMFFSSPW